MPAVHHGDGQRRAGWFAGPVICEPVRPITQVDVALVLRQPGSNITNGRVYSPITIDDHASVQGLCFGQKGYIHPIQPHFIQRIMQLQNFVRPTAAIDHDCHQTGVRVCKGAAQSQTRSECSILRSAAAAIRFERDGGQQSALRRGRLQQCGSQHAAVHFQQFVLHL